MKLWKNEKFRRSMICMLLIMTVTVVATGVFSVTAAVISSAGEIVLLLLFIRYTRKRMAEISRLSDEVDRVLHGKQELSIADAKEGELAVLSAELEKMTLALLSQADALKQQKQVMSKAIADISHQLRTPLTALNLTADLLSNDGLPEQERRKHVRELKVSLSRMESLTEALLKTAKLDSGTIAFQKKRIPVSVLIGKSLEPLQIPMDIKGITVDLSCEDTSFVGDMEWSVEAFGNLLKNCVQHTPTSGRITVESQETPIATEIVITDSGTGFMQKDIPHLFERFYRGENASPESVGIGLALSREIIKAQNGTIKAENGKNGGAVFRVKFYKRIV